MRRLSIEARSPESAAGLLTALAAFSPKLVESGGVQCVEITFDGGTASTIAVLNALEEHVTERETDAARVDLDGDTYLLEGRAQTDPSLGPANA